MKILSTNRLVQNVLASLFIRTKTRNKPNVHQQRNKQISMDLKNMWSEISQKKRPLYDFTYINSKFRQKLIITTETKIAPPQEYTKKGHKGISEVWKCFIY